MEHIFDNPISLLFLSYMIGAVVTPFIKNSTWRSRVMSEYNISDKWTKRLGILLLLKIIIVTPLRHFNPKLYLKSRPNKEELLQLKQDFTDAAVGHLIGFYVLLALCLVYLVLGKSWKLILVIFLMNVYLNLFLVFLQQYNNRRVNRFLTFFE